MRFKIGYVRDNKAVCVYKVVYALFYSSKKWPQIVDLQPLSSRISGVPKGIRTPVTAVKGRCPRPLDDGDVYFPSLSPVVWLGLKLGNQNWFTEPSAREALLLIAKRFSRIKSLVELGGIEPPTSTLPV